MVPNVTSGSDVPKPLPHQSGGGKLSDDSRKQSISQNQLKDCPLTKQDILHVYSDVFTGIGKFPGTPYKFQLKENAKPARPKNTWNFCEIFGGG